MNFSFLSPIFLIGIAAVALPVIAHLISRKSGMKKKFPAVRFLLASQGEMATRSRLKDIVLLSLRALIIALIALLFAKPGVFSFSNSVASEPKALGVVVDNSFSMGYGDNFKRAIEEAKRIIGSYPDGSFFAVVPLVNLKSEALSVIQDRGGASKSVEQIALSQSFTDNEKRLEEVYSSLQKAPNEEKEIVLITDNQKNGWRDEDYKRTWLKVVDISNEQTEGNLAVSNISSRYSNEAAMLRVRVSNFSDSKTNELLTKAELSGEEINAYLNIEPNEFSTEEFIFNQDANNDQSAVAGTVSIPKDKLTVDDKRHFVLSTGGALNVLIVDGDPREDARSSESYYLASAAEAASELLPARIRIIDNESFLDVDVSSYDLIFLTNVGEITPRLALSLTEFADRGGTLVIFPGERVKSGSYNALFQDLLPGELGLQREVQSTLIAGDTDKFSDGLFGNLAQTRINRIYEITPSENSITVLNLQGGYPFLSYLSYGQGNVFLFASTSDNAWGNFAITPVFAPLIKEFLDFESTSNTSRRNYIVGDSVMIDRPRDVSIIEVVNPSGNKSILDSQEPKFIDTSLTGIYSVLADGEEFYKFSVNVNPLESNLEKLAVPKVDSGNDSSGLGLVQIFNELWRYFLWGVIALFITESAARAFFS